MPVRFAGEGAGSHSESMMEPNRKPAKDRRDDDTKTQGKQPGQGQQQKGPATKRRDDDTTGKSTDKKRADDSAQHQQRDPKRGGE